MAGQKTLTNKEIVEIIRGVTDPIDIAKVIEVETRKRCAAICEEIYQRSMRDWKDDNCRFNLGYAHGADECCYAMTGKTFIK